MRVVEAQFVTSAADARGIPRDGVPHVAFVGRSNVGKSSLINALTRARLARTSAAPGKTRLANLYRIAVDGGPGGPGRWTVYFADLPGYGYARGGADSVAELARIADAYFASAGAAGLKPRPTYEDGRQDRASAAGRGFSPGENVGRGVSPGDEAGLKPRPTYEDPRDAGRGVSPDAGRDASPDVGRGFSPGNAPRRTLVLHVVDARHPGLEADIDAAAWLATLGLERVVIANKVDKLSRAGRAKTLREIERTLGTAALPVSAERGEGLDDLWVLIAKTIRQQQ